MSDCELIQLCGDDEPEVIEIAGNDEPDVIEVDEPGPPGLSAYQIAVSHGFTGTEEEWLASLQASVEGLEVDDVAGLPEALEARILASAFSAFTLTMLDDVDAPTWRASLGLGDAATKDVGSAAGQVAAGDHTHPGLSVQAAGTPSVRAIGTGATEAAAGNHVHAVIDGVTAGTALANKALITNAANQIGGVSWIKSGAFEVGSGSTLGDRHILYDAGGANPAIRLRSGATAKTVLTMEGPAGVNATSHGLGWRGVDAAIMANGASGPIGCRNPTNTEDRDFTARALMLSGALFLGPYTFATKPSAATSTGSIIRVTDRSQRIAYSDGTDWRWLADDVVAS